ncbi:MAG: hypothetical protein LBQ55_05340 [Treponema sp.]|nr:hypothetical protein [Treponema sp.]
MTPSRRALCLALAAALCLLTQAARGQEQTSSDYYVRTVDGKALIVQRLSWPGDENVSRYELVVERREPGGFVEIHRELTENTFVELSLRPGSYRYHVLMYNLLSRYEYTTNWVSLNIILAVRPELDRFSPKSFALYGREERQRELVLRGRNLAEGAELLLTPAGRITDRPPVAPRSFIPDPSGEEAAALFDASDLRPGRYRVTVRNPGGLETSLESFEIIRVGEFTLAAGYAPLVPLYGYLSDLFDRPVSPLGAYARFSYYPLPYPLRNLGIEAAAFWNYLESEKNSADISTHAEAFQVNLAYRIWLFDKPLALNIRAGGGLQYMAAFFIEFGRRKKDISTWIPLLDGGIFFQWNFHESFHAEIGAEYIHLLSVDRPQPGFLRPFLGAGWQF